MAISHLSINDTLLQTRSLSSFEWSLLFFFHFIFTWACSRSLPVLWSVSVNSLDLFQKQTFWSASAKFCTVGIMSCDFWRLVFLQRASRFRLCLFCKIYTLCFWPVAGAWFLLCHKKLLSAAKGGSSAKEPNFPTLFFRRSKSYWGVFHLSLVSLNGTFSPPFGSSHFI